MIHDPRLIVQIKILTFLKGKVRFRIRPKLPDWTIYLPIVFPHSPFSVSCSERDLFQENCQTF